MYHFFVSPEQIGENHIRITGADVNHIKNVLRMRPGEKVLIGNGQDKDYLCEISEILKEEVLASILAVDETGTELPSKIYLFQGLPKSDKMELIIQKAVELGVYKIIPVSTKRAVVKLDEKKEAAKLKRWNSICESAAKQSKRTVIPEVSSVMGLQQAFDFAKTLDQSIMPFEHQEGMADTKETFRAIEPGMSVGVFIGPEGGFEDSEVEDAKSSGIIPVTLGRRILRTETAGLAVLSVLMFQLEG